MKLVYGDMGHILTFDGGYVNELVIENRGMFFSVVGDMASQVDGGQGKFVLSIKDKPVEISRYADITVQFAPFELNRKSLLTKLCTAIEGRALLAENYIRTAELLCDLERYILHLSDDLPFDVECKKLAIGPIVKAIAPEIAEGDKSPLEKIFAYMELVRELDRDRLFVMVNMRTYFTDGEMESFAESVCLHGFRVLLLEGTSQNTLKNVRRYTIDDDLCEF